MIIPTHLTAATLVWHVNAALNNRLPEATWSLGFENLSSAKLLASSAWERLFFCALTAALDLSALNSSQNFGIFPQSMRIALSS